MRPILGQPWLWRKETVFLEQDRDGHSALITVGADGAFAFVIWIAQYPRSASIVVTGTIYYQREF